MLTLAFDTASRLGSVGLAREGELLAESLLSVRATRSETLLAEVDRLLARCGEDRDAVRRVVVGAGPGSFTGVRIAASVAKGLCFQREVALFAYSSLWAVAAGTGLAERVCALFDARRGEVYAMAYASLEPPEIASGPEAVRVADLLGRPEFRGWCFAGDGALVHRETIEASGGRVLGPHLAYPRAGTLLWLAERWPDRGAVAAPDLWEPEYVRRSSAWRSLSEAG